MGASTFLDELSQLAGKLKQNEERIATAAEKAADTIEKGHLVHLFGSGHSVIPTMDCFPRYGGFVGFHPIMDARLMWTTVSGSGGAEELIWLERQEGYIAQFLKHVEWKEQDMLLVVSHGGQNAAPVEMALAAKEAGLYVVALTSRDNHEHKPATHSSGQKIGDIADLILFNEVASEDAAVSIPGVKGNVGGLSTLSAIAVIQALVSETAQKLSERAYYVQPFASPNVEGIAPDHNDQVYVQYRKRLKR